MSSDGPTSRVALRLKVIRLATTDTFTASCTFAEFRTSATDIVADVRNSAKVQLAVKVSVVANLMTFSRSATRDVGPSLDMSTEKEERHLYVCPLERVEDQRRRIGIWPVIEGQRYVMSGRGQLVQDGSKDGTVSIECPVRGRPRRGKRGRYGEDHAAADRRARTLSYCSRTDRVTRGQEYCSASRRPVFPSRVRSVSSSRSVTIASASASRSPHGTIRASRPFFTTSLKPSMSEQTTGVSQAIDSSNVIPKDAFVVGHAYIAACA